ncbi:MAG: ComF family protein [Clostridia bacterium]|nr:ComF family protein [Clostridia bacterium]
MTKIDKIMRQICTVPRISLNLIYPKICGICGKINRNSLCKKCEIQLKKQAEIKIIKNGQDLENKYFSQLMYIFKYEGVIRKTILDYKFNDRPYISKTFVNFMLKDKKIFDNIQKYETIIPVPISKRRQKERGYNQSLLIAREISKQTNLDLMNNCLIKTKNIIEQSKLNKDEREKNIQGVYKLVNKQLIKNKKILVIDDIYTTGSTVNECSKVLIQGQPTKIGILVLAKD